MDIPFQVFTILLDDRKRLQLQAVSTEVLYGHLRSHRCRTVFQCSRNGTYTEFDHLRSKIWHTLPSVLAVLACFPLAQSNMLSSLSPEMRLGQDPDLLAKSRR